MIKKVAGLFILLILCCFSFISPSFAANILFSDDFSDPVKTNTTWEKSSYLKVGGTFNIIPNPNHWFVDNGVYLTHITTQQTASTAMAGDISWKNYTVDLNIFMEKGVDLGIWFRAKDFFNRYSLNPRFPLTSDPTTPEIKLDKVEAGVPTLLGKIKYPLEYNKKYKITISVQGKLIKIWIDNNLIFNIIDLPSKLSTGKVGLQGWSGSLSEVIGKFDDLTVTEIPQSPIVVIPGFGASWNLNLFTKNIASGLWTKTPFLDTYNNLKATLTSPTAEYKEGVGYFEFYYDWRKKINKPNSNDDLVYDLKKYIDNVVLKDKPSETQVKIVGHSMGGLLARAYAQEYGTDKIEKIITVGSPHEGVTQVYNAWEGGEVDDKLSWGNLTLQLLLQINKNSFQTNVDAIRTISPSIQDMLPIFDYLKNAQNSAIPFSNMKHKNDWLVALKNSLATNTKNVLVTAYGKENNPQEDTLEWLKVTSQSWLEKLLGQWEDGKPINKINSPNGDLTVLTKSASISGVLATPILLGDHNSIISSTDGIQKILENLDIYGVSPIMTPSLNLSRPALFFFLHSPANIKITTSANQQIGYGVTNTIPNGFYSEENKLIIIPNAQSGNYIVQLVGTGTGIYHLDIGQLTLSKDQWQTITGKITSQETQTLLLNFNVASPQDNILIDPTGLNYLTMAKVRLEELNNYFKDRDDPLPTRKRIQYSIQQINKSIDQAINYLNKNNGLSSSKSVLTAIGDSYQLRQDINGYFKKNQLLLISQTYGNNELKDVGDLLTQAWIIIYKNAGKTISLSTAQMYKNTAQTSVATSEQKIKTKISGESKLVGIPFSLAYYYNQKANTLLGQNQLEASYIYSLLSRNLSLEVLGLLK